MASPATFFTRSQQGRRTRTIVLIKEDLRPANPGPGDGAHSAAFVEPRTKFDNGHRHHHLGRRLFRARPTSDEKPYSADRHGLGPGAKRHQPTSLGSPYLSLSAPLLELASSPAPFGLMPANKMVLTIGIVIMASDFRDRRRVSRPSANPYKAPPLRISSRKIKAPPATVDFPPPSWRSAGERRPDAVPVDCFRGRRHRPSSKQYEALRAQGPEAAPSFGPARLCRPDFAAGRWAVRDRIVVTTPSTPRTFDLPDNQALRSSAFPRQVQRPARSTAALSGMSRAMADAAALEGNRAARSGQAGLPRAPAPKVRLTKPPDGFPSASTRIKASSSTSSHQARRA